MFAGLALLTALPACAGDALSLDVVVAQQNRAPVVFQVVCAPGVRVQKDGLMKWPMTASVDIGCESAERAVASLSVQLIGGYRAVLPKTVTGQVLTASSEPVAVTEHMGSVSVTPRKAP